MMIYLSLILNAVAIVILLFDLLWVNKIVGNVFSRCDLLKDLIVENENSLESIERMKKVISAYQDDLK